MGVIIVRMQVHMRVMLRYRMRHRIVTNVQMGMTIVQTQVLIDNLNLVSTLQAGILKVSVFSLFYRFSLISL